MNIYYLMLTENARRFSGYDTYSSFVVIAENEHEARMLTTCADECLEYLSEIKGKSRYTRHDSKEDCIWLDGVMTSCELIGVANEANNEPMIVCESFHAG